MNLSTVDSALHNPYASVEGPQYGLLQSMGLQRGNYGGTKTLWGTAEYGFLQVWVKTKSTVEL